MANSADPDQTAPIGAVCSGSTLFAYILNLSEMLGYYLQQTTSAVDIFRCIFFLGAFRGNVIKKKKNSPEICGFTVLCCNRCFVSDISSDIMTSQTSKIG